VTGYTASKTSGGQYWIVNRSDGKSLWISVTADGPGKPRVATAEEAIERAKRIWAARVALSAKMQ
jgi:hypothetical protein